MHYNLCTMSKAYSCKVEDERTLLYASKLWREGPSSSAEERTQRRKKLDSNFTIALNLNVVFKSDSALKKILLSLLFSCTSDDQNGRELLCFSSLFNIKNQN